MKPLAIPMFLLAVSSAAAVQAAPVVGVDRNLSSLDGNSAITLASTFHRATTFAATTFAATTRAGTTLGATTRAATTLGATTFGATRLAQ
jgi:hypothetical protein